MPYFWSVSVLRKASRVALIGNIAFGACVLLRYTRYLHDQDLSSILIIMGWLLGVWINLLVNAWVLVLWIRKNRGIRPGAQPSGWERLGIPPWLGRVNALVALFQIWYLFII